MVKHVSFWILCVFGSGEGYKNYAGAFSVLLSTKTNIFQLNRSTFYQIRGFCAIIGHHFKEIVVIIFTENVKIMGRNIAIRHFDTCGLSSFLQNHFYVK